MKKALALIIVLSIVGITGISLYIYAQGGIQDKHIRKGKHLNIAEESSVLSLINTEFRIELEKQKDQQGGKYPWSIFYQTKDSIYWGRVKYDFLRNTIIKLYCSDRTEYDRIMNQMNHVTMQKSREMITEWCIHNNYLENDYDSVTVDIWDAELTLQGGKCQVYYHGYITEWKKKTKEHYYPCEFHGNSYNGKTIDYISR